MLKIKKIIWLNITRHDGFEWYYLLIEKIEENIGTNPDIAIETCKSLIEWISKYILTKTDNTYSSSISLEAPQLVKRMLQKLWEASDEELDDMLVNRLVSLVIRICELRNKRGDISHWKLYPKDEISWTNSSHFVVSITDDLLYYVLNIFFSIDVESQLIDYETNTEFNDDLDERNPIWMIRYSKALYEQKYEEYIIQLDEFIWDTDTIKEEIVENSTEKVVSTWKKEEKKWKKEEKRSINLKKVKRFCENNKINEDKFILLLETYIFRWTEPLNDEVAQTLSYKPKLQDRNSILQDIKNNLDDLIIVK